MKETAFEGVAYKMGAFCLGIHVLIQKQSHMITHMMKPVAGIRSYITCSELS